MIFIVLKIIIADSNLLIDGAVEYFNRYKRSDLLNNRNIIGMETECMLFGN